MPDIRVILFSFMKFVINTSIKIHTGWGQKGSDRSPMVIKGDKNRDTYVYRICTEFRNLTLLTVLYQGIRKAFCLGPKIELKFHGRIAA